MSDPKQEEKHVVMIDKNGVANPKEPLTIDIISSNGTVGPALDLNLRDF